MYLMYLEMIFQWDRVRKIICVIMRVGSWRVPNFVTRPVVMIPKRFSVLTGPGGFQRSVRRFLPRGQREPRRRSHVAHGSRCS